MFWQFFLPLSNSRVPGKRNESHHTRKRFCLFIPSKLPKNTTVAFIQSISFIPQLFWKCFFIYEIQTPSRHTSLRGCVTSLLFWCWENVESECNSTFTKERNIQDYRVLIVFMFQFGMVSKQHNVNQRRWCPLSGKRNVLTGHIYLLLLPAFQSWLSFSHSSPTPFSKNRSLCPSKGLKDDLNIKSINLSELL